MVRDRKEYYDNMADQQMSGIDNNYLRENDPRMPMLQPERQSRVTFGSNSKK